VTRDFDLGDILTIVTGNLVSPRHMDGVYDILNFIAGEPIYTHQIPRVLDEAKPVVLRQHPQLASVTFPEDAASAAGVASWLADRKAEFGDTLPISPMNIAEHERIDPVSELAERIHPSRIIVR
jgi:hypothetical protein